MVSSLGRMGGSWLRRGPVTFLRRNVWWRRRRKARTMGDHRHKAFFCFLVGVVLVKYTQGIFFCRRSGKLKGGCVGISSETKKAFEYCSRSSASESTYCVSSCGGWGWCYSRKISEAFPAAGVTRSTQASSSNKPRQVHHTALIVYSDSSDRSETDVPYERTNTRLAIVGRQEQAQTGAGPWAVREEADAIWRKRVRPPRVQRRCRPGHVG